MILNIAHSFLNIFAGGRSEVKVLLFILYLMFLVALYLCFRNYSLQFFKALKWRWFGITLFAMYIYGLVLHIFYTLSNHLLLRDFFITGNNGEISSSTLLHTHLAKGVIGQVFSFFGKTQLQTMDAGSAYLGLIPSGVFLIGSLILLVLLLQAIFYFVTSFKTFLAHKNKRQKTFLIIGYAIVTFSLIKTSVDGGIFNSSFIITSIFIALFVLQAKGKFIINYYYFLSLVGVGLIATSLYIDSFRYGSGLGIAYVAVLSLLYTILLYGIERKIRLQFLIPLLVLFMLGWWVASVRDRAIYDYSKILLQSGQKIFIYNAKSKEVEISKVEQPESIAQLSKLLNKNVTYLPVTIPGITCMEKAPFEEFSVTLISAKPISSDTFTPTEYVWIKNENSVAWGEKWQTKLKIFINQCLPEPLSVVDGELQKNNINTYLLVNPTFYDNSNY